MQPTTKWRFPGCRFQLFMYQAGLVLNGAEARVAPDADPGRHLVKKTTEMLRFGGGQQQGGINSAFCSFSPASG